MYNGGIMSKPARKKRVAKRTNLTSALQSIYHDAISLETTQTCECTCCKVAMPQINYSEFVNIVTSLWRNADNNKKVELICTSIEYWFKNQFEKWGIQSLVKPCMLLDRKTGLCTIYKDRPLNCRLYGLWPKAEYEKRVDRFAKSFERFGLAREDLPLNKQCDKVKRVDETTALTTEKINELFSKLDELDKSMGDFSSLQVTQRENYRTFHDWLLLKIFGDQWLAMLTSFMLAADRKAIEEQIDAIKAAIRLRFSIETPVVNVPSIG